MATRQPADDRPASPNTALRPAGDEEAQPLRSLRRMPIEGGQPISRAATPASNDRRRAGATMSTYRQLVARGLTPGEAANLTAYLNRLPIGDQPWTLTQVNTLLFLRSLHMSGRFGPADGNPMEIRNGV